jgi:hypothetical protein
MGEHDPKKKYTGPDMRLMEMCNFNLEKLIIFPYKHIPGTMPVYLLNMKEYENFEILHKLIYEHFKAKDVMDFKKNCLGESMT